MFHSFAIAMLAGTAMLLFNAGAARAGEPVPEVGISLEEIPGGIMTTVGSCRNRGGKVVQQGGKWVCTGARAAAKPASGKK